MVLFAVQVFLVNKRRTEIHRRLGIFGVLVAAAILVAGYTTAIAGARTGWAGPRSPRDAMEALNFLVVPLGDLVLFLGFLGSALYFRKQPEIHKRLMILAWWEGSSRQHSDDCPAPP
jgi:F0F1-type ATP synthase membrane subunit c/vacuolar-type H+-ATPase subunit K